MDLAYLAAEKQTCLFLPLLLMRAFMLDIETKIPNAVKQPENIRKRLTRWSLEAWGVAWANPETAVTLVASVLLGVFAIFGGIQNAQFLSGAILAVLALISFSLLAGAKRRADGENKVEALQSEVRTLSGNIERMGSQTADLNSRFSRSLSLLEIPAGPTIQNAFNEAMAKTDGWRYKGGTGSFLRPWTLPELANRARPRKINLPVKIDIIDPRDESVCQEYSQYRMKLDGHRSIEPSEQWTLERVRLECCACVLAAVWYSQNEFLEIDLALSRSMSVLRYDIASKCAILTNEDKNFPALLAKKDSLLYCGFVAEMERRMSRSKDRGDNLDNLVLKKAPKLPEERDSVSVEAALAVLQALGMPVDKLTPEERKSLPHLALERELPYRR